MRLKDVGGRFRSKLQIVDGQKFYGQILDLPDTSRVSNFLSARRYLKVFPTSPVSAGDVIIKNNEKFLVASHGVGYFRNPLYIHYKLFKVDEERNWLSRGADTTDSVTGVKKKGTTVDNGSVHLSVQPRSDISDQLNIQSPRHLVITNVAVKVDDKLGDDWVVTKVDPVLDLYLVEVKEG